MIIVIMRAIIMYIVVLFSLRIMGKGEVGELQPFDLVVSLMIAELAALPMEDLNSPMSLGLTAIFTLVFLQCLTSYLSLKSTNFRKIVSGRPSILFSHGKFNLKEMERLRVNINDILGQIRLSGCSNMNEIDYLIMETNGQMSVIQSSNGNSSNGCSKLPIPIVLDGKIMYDNIEKYNLSQKALEDEMKKRKMNLNEILYGVVDEKDNYTLYRRS